MKQQLKRRFLHPLVLAAILTAVFVYSGQGRALVLAQDPYRSVIQEPDAAVLEGTLCSNPVKTAGGSFYSAEVSLSSVRAFRDGMSLTAPASGRVTVLIPASEAEALYPMRLRSLAVSDGFLFESGASVSFRVRRGREAGLFYVEEVLYSRFGGGIADRLRYGRALARLMFKRLMCAWGAAGALILSLLSGAREYTDQSVSLAFRNAGLSHILALSGMHLSFFSSLAGTASSKLFGKGRSFIPRLCAILLFTFFAGLTPSLLRALLCSLVMLVSQRVFCGKLSFLHVLCAVFLLHVALRPGDCLSVAFMLSYLSLFGILLVSDALTVLLVRILPPKTAQSVSASAGAQLATAPVSASVFGTVTPVGIVSTVVISPLISVFLTVAMLGIIFSLCMPFLSAPFGYILNAGYRLILLLVELFAAVPPVTV